MSDTGYKSDSTPNVLPPGWDVQRLQRLMLAAISALVRSGWFVAPDDVHDLSQSFLAHFWEELLPKWDAQRASFATYVYSQFAWFAKSWLLDNQRSRQKLADLEVFRDRYRQSAAEIAEQRELLLLTQKAFDRLSLLTQSILSAYLSADRPSQRELAARFHTTRHDIRNHLANGIGELLVQFPQPADISPNDWRVLLCLYSQGLTVAETSRYLHRPWVEIRDIRDALLSRLLHPPRV